MSIYKKENILAVYNGGAFFSKHLFTMFALGGSLVLLLMKMMGVPQYITLFIPIVCIIAYCVIPSRYPLFLITEDRIGDNAYYLGFLYTLTSLSYALWGFASGSNSPDDIIRSFGVALSSTFIGVVARVYYSSLRQDPDDIEKDARLRISAASNALTVELYQATTAFNVYRRTLQQSIEEAFTSLNEQVDKTITDSTTAVSTNITKLGDDISSTYVELNNNSSSLVDSVKNSVKSINTINSKVEKSFSTLNESALSFDNFIKQQAESISGISSAVESFVKMSQVICQQITQTNEQITSLGQAGQNVTGVTDKINANLNDFSKTLSDISGKQKDLVTTIEQHADELKLQLGKSRKYTEETHNSLSDMARTLADKLQ